MNLETERLILRNLRESDLEDFHSFRSNPEICKFQGFDAFTIEDSKKFIEEQKDLQFGTPGKWVQTGIVWKENNKLIGDFALKPEAHEPRIIEIGITLDLDYQGKGIAVETFKRVFDHLFDETETQRIFGILDVENVGSLRLVENLNFRREAHYKKSYWDKNMNEWRDEYLYAFLKKDWKKMIRPRRNNNKARTILK